ncbi:nucleotidyltransferase domain-containing protein [Cellulosilyticum sp. I15G10I2]|uniref:nucleotidyltransferase domain-containing protein n=1 Tax=Cellulosilyticum sp. I15G10I2 TaxID=1892843 RepID=UPI00085BCCE4|nr:nucleotidyltransferase domain-containing protein [Cellulosilyticum sp. I15G10I2]
MRDEMYNKIQKTLQQIEEQRDITILYAAESGTRGWGFPSKDSDYHCRFIYIHPQEFYLAVNEEKDYIELSVDSIYDIQGWDLKKVLKSIQKSDPTVSEWLQSPVIYMEKEGFRETLLNLNAKYFDEKPALNHYRSIAATKLEDIKNHKEQRLKRYFYVLRSLLATDYIMANHSMPPMTFQALYECAAIHQDLCDEIEKLIETKAGNNDWLKIPTHDALIKCFEGLLKKCDNYLQKADKSQRQDDKALNQFFRDWIGN